MWWWSLRKQPEYAKKCPQSMIGIYKIWKQDTISKNDPISCRMKLFFWRYGGRKWIFPSGWTVPFALKWVLEIMMGKARFSPEQGLNSGTSNSKELLWKKMRPCLMAIWQIGIPPTAPPPFTENSWKITDIFLKTSSAQQTCHLYCFSNTLPWAIAAFRLF